MELKKVNSEDMKAYQAEAKERWGDTDEYKEFELHANQGADMMSAGEKMMVLLGDFGRLREKDPADPEIQKKVENLQQFITDNLYTCTDEVLAGLGKMYTTDERFKISIDKMGGVGTAEFINEAITAYLSK